MRLLLLGAALLLVCAPAASAASRNEIIRDCADDGRLDKEYSKSELRDARNNLPADVDEYTDCRDVLRRAELGDGSTAGGGGGTGGSGGAAPSAPLTPASPQEEAALAAARKSSDKPVHLPAAHARVAPGAQGFASYAARHDLPWPLIAVLALVALAALAAAAQIVRRRVVARRAHPA
jgi:hypothetical protein